MNKKRIAVSCLCLILIVGIVCIVYMKSNRERMNRELLNQQLALQESEKNTDEQPTEITQIVQTSSEYESESQNEQIETTVEPIYTDDGLRIVTDTDFTQVIKIRDEQTYWINVLGEEMLFPQGTILGLYLDEYLDEDYVLMLTGEYNGIPVRNYWNRNQQFTDESSLALENGTQTGNKHVRRLVLDGTIYSCTSLVAGCTKLEEADLKNAHNEKGFYQFQMLFSGCTGLKQVSLPENMIEISMGMFMECSALEQLYIPESVISIDALAFYNCTGLKELKLGSGIENIGYNAFTGCEQLTIIAEKGSYAYNYAVEHGIPVETEN